MKHTFREDPRARAVTRKPLVPGDDEIAANPRARSAKLRVAERVDGGGLHDAPKAKRSRTQRAVALAVRHPQARSAARAARAAGCTARWSR